MTTANAARTAQVAQKKVKTVEDQYDDFGSELSVIFGLAGVNAVLLTDTVDPAD